MIRMKVNDIDISEYGAELIDRAASTQIIKSTTDWFDGSIQGSLLKQSYDYKNIRITFVIKGISEDDSYKKISKLTEALKKCNIKFDDIDLIFPCILNGAAVPDRLQNGVFKISYILFNDWGIGDSVNLEYTIPQIDVQEIKIAYIENWATTAKGYSQCYEKKELYKTIAEETIYIDKSKVAAAAQQNNSWVNFFLALGVDIDKYKPKTNNTLNGFVDLNVEYNAAAAQTLFNTKIAFDIYYNRFQKSNIPDLPIDTNYPSVVWSVDTNEQGYYFDLGVGNGWNIQDITIYSFGRWFEASGGGCMFGAGTDEDYNLALNMPNASYNLGMTVSPIITKVFNSSTSGSKIILQTFEDIDDTPLRKYGFKSANNGAAPLNGYADIIFNGVTLNRTQVKNKILTNNITLFYGKQGIAKFCEMARIQIYYRGKLVRDIIPITGNVKNGFVNNYDTGLYDMISMTYIPWSKLNGDKGQKPNEILNIPAAAATPQPPKPFIPTYTVTVVNGTGSGQYKTGTHVSIVANPAPVLKEFSNWSVNSGNVTIANPALASTEFVMSDENVTVTANYKNKGVIPEILYYKSLEDINSETEMGQNKKVWATSSSNGDGPKAYGNFVAVYSVPSVHGEWSIYNNSYYAINGQERDKWDRQYIKFRVTRGRAATGQYITYTPQNGNPIQQNFNIKSI